MSRFPNPFAAVTDLVAKAFATMGDRDGPGGRAFVVGLSRPRTRHASHTPTPQSTASPANNVEATAPSAETSRTMPHRRHMDSRQ